MKTVMYHYVRNYNKKSPFSNFLKKDQFINQITNFTEYGAISDYKQMFIPSKKFLLTFDDGLKDHLWVAETLNKKKIIGIFFITSLQYEKKELLDVHKAHLITGKVKGKEILYELEKFLKKKKIKNFLNTKDIDRFSSAYELQNDEYSKKEFKRIINYYCKINYRSKILNYLLNKFEIKSDVRKYYLTPKEIKYISDLGMVIGSHSHSHNLLSRLSRNNQFREIKKNKIFLENIIKKNIETFCYPYGGNLSYNTSTLGILKNLKFKLGFKVENKKITKSDLKFNSLELPRFDCNKFL